MRPASRMIFRLLLISEDPQLIASVHALEHRRRVATRGIGGVDLPDRSVEVTFVSSLVSALTAVEAAVETNRPFEIVVIDRQCSEVTNESIVRELWTVAPQLCVIDCGLSNSGCEEFQAADATLQQSSGPHCGKRFRLPRSIENDQLTQLVDTLLDRAALRQRCRSMQSELERMARRLDELEGDNQTLNNKVSRLGLKRQGAVRHPTVTHIVERRDFAETLEERRSHGPAVRRVSVACEPVADDDHPSVRQTPGLNLAATTEPHEDISDETQLRGRVLIVDDVPGNRRLASFLLEHAGATVVQAESGQAMLDLFNQSVTSGKTFDSIVLHMAMQEMDGYECARQLRSRGYHGPIIAATACNLPLDRHLCMSAGCDEFVTMPLDRNQFIRTLRRMLNATPATV